MDDRGERKWRRRLADLLELPREIVLNLPKVTIIGNLQCYLENHRGVIEYTAERVRVSVNGGEVIIDGRDLVIRYMTDDEIAIDGSVNRVHYEF